MGGSYSIHPFDNLPVATRIDPIISKTDNPIVETALNDAPEKLRALRYKVKDRLYYTMNRNTDSLDFQIEMRVMEMEAQLIKIWLREICEKHKNEIDTALDNIREIDIYHSTIVTILTSTRIENSSCWLD